MYENEAPRGEYVLVIAGKDREQVRKEERQRWDNMSIEDHVAVYEEQGLSRKDAMKRAAADRGVTKREIYEYLLKNGD